MANGDGFDIQGLLGNPLFNIGTGLLVSGLSGPESFGQGLGQGLQFGMQQMGAASRNQFIRERILAGQAERQQQEKRQKALEELTGLLGGETTTPQQGDPDDLTATTTAPDQKKVMGLLAQVAPEHFVKGLLAQMTPQEPTSLQRNFEFLTSIGVPPDKALEALKKGTTVNVGDSKLDQPLTPSDSLKMRLPDGSTPPIGTTMRQAAALGATVMTAEQQKAMEASKKFGGILDKLEDLAVGKGGVFTNIQPGLDNRIKAGLDLFIGSLTRERPNIEAYESLAQGTISPFVRQLGESGALSDGDVNRALGLLPQIRDGFLLPDTREDAVNKLNALGDIVNKGVDKLRGQTKAAPKAPAKKKPAVIDFNELP